MNKVLCKTCCKWVDCSKDRPMGFCLEEDLFTYTERIMCGDYCEGKPMTEAEWEHCEEDESIYEDEVS